MRSTAIPSAASSLMSVLDLRLGADVDPASRIVEEQDPWVEAQHSREQDLLLIPAGELADLLAGLDALMRKRPSDQSTSASCWRRETKPAFEIDGQRCQHDVVADRQRRDDALGLAILRDQGDAGRDRGAG